MNPQHSQKNISWEEEKVQMKEVIDKQSKLIRILSEQNKSLNTTIDQYKKHAKGPESAENIESEFTVCKDNITFDDVGGLEPIIDRLRYFQQGIENPIIYQSYAIRPPRGLLLHGPPGCGKTMIAKAVSNELDSYFLELPITRVISKWVGEAEKTLEAILQKCNQIYQETGSKVVVFVDEAEQMFRSRGNSGEHGVIDRCVNVWLRYMDGMAEGEGIIYVAATNKVELIDSAILRAGRFDHVVEIPIPDAQGIEQIFRKQAAYKERMAQRQIYEITDYSRLAKLMSGFHASGADVAEVMRLCSERKICTLLSQAKKDEPTSYDVLISQYALEHEIAQYAKSRTFCKDTKIGFHTSQ